MPSYDALLRQAARCQEEAYRPGTRAAHSRALKTFLSFCNYYSIPYARPAVDHVLAFIEYIRPRMKSPASIKNTIGSLSTAFKRMDLNAAVFSSFKVQLALKSIEVNSRYIPSPKLPVTPDELDAVINYMKRAHADPAVICALAFAFTGLFCQSNLAPHMEALFDPTRHLMRGDVTRVPCGIQVRVKCSKTIQRAQDATSITLPRIPGRAFCPVTSLECMIIASPTADQRAPLFITREGRTMSISFLKKAWNSALKALGMPTDRLSLHSLRSGGATAVWSSGKVSDLDLMRHGTWRSEAWKAYVRPSATESTVLQAFKDI